MSAKTATELESHGLESHQTRVGEMIVVDVASGIWNVANFEHDDVSEHTYTVDEDGCNCPAAKWHSGKCKHEDAVDKARQRDADDDCDCVEDFPCWPCYRDGKRDLPA